MSGELAPAGARAPWPRVLLAQTAMEVRLTLRRGESLVLTLAIPLVLLVFFAKVDVFATGPDDRSRLDFLVPGVLALAVISTAMTGLAIATGFERQYGVLKRLGASPLTRPLLLGAKALGVLVVELVQCVAIVLVGLALGWRPGGLAGAVAAAGVVLLGTACFAGLGLLLAGTLRAEATLAAANGLHLLLILLGGVVVPLARLPEPARSVGRLTPAHALSEAMRGALAATPDVAAAPVLVLVAWSVVGLGAAAATFRWE